MNPTDPNRPPAPTSPNQTHSDVASQIVQLKTLPMPQLWALWDEHFERRPGHHHRTYLESRIAYKIQERAFGALPAGLRRRLEKIGESGTLPRPGKRERMNLVPGTTLIREQNGVQHRVTAMEDGRFEYRGQPYTSLSAIAKAITGSQWNGPKFFGLRPYGKVKQDGE